MFRHLAEDQLHNLFPPFQAFVKLNKTLPATITPISYLCSSVNNEILIMYLEFMALFPW